MGDNSRLVVSGETSLFAIRANTAAIGNGAIVVGRGHDGTAADSSGGDGTARGPGPTIVLVFEQLDIKGLRVAALGGAGGAGGKGTTGRRGRNPTCYGDGATPGGPGSRGGNGGDAGDGGNIIVLLPSDASTYVIELNVNAGEPGAQGEGGDGGPGGRGLDCGIWKRGGDPDGPDGPDGEPGARGQRGTVQWRHPLDFTPEMVVKALRETASLFEGSGYTADAIALAAFLDAGVLATK